MCKEAADVIAEAAGQALTDLVSDGVAEMKKDVNDMISGMSKGFR
jgi:hypothetical protein